MQTLYWQTGDRYRTEDGTVMEIVAVVDPVIYCRDNENAPHDFTIRRGWPICGDCTHGNLMSRISGSVVA